MGKQHLDALATATRLLESHCLGQLASDIAGILVQIARYISHRRAGTALHLEGADIAVSLGGTITKRIPVVHCSSRVQQLIVRTHIDVALSVKEEVCPREGPV